MSMKKSFIWMCAAALTCGMAFTSCAKMDYPTGPEYFWEKTANVIDFEDGTTPFTGDSRITVGVGTVSGWDSQVATFKGAGNAQNGYSFAHYDFSSKVEKAQKVIISFDYFNANSRAIVTVGDALVRGNSGGSSKTTYNGKGGVFRIGSDKNNFFINGTTMGAVGDWCNKWMKVNMTVYCFERKYEWSVTDIATGDILAESADKEDFWQADANEATQIDVFGYINNGDNCYIDNLSIESGVNPDVKYADAKIIYVDPEGNELKEAREVAGARVGTYITLIESDKAAIYNADKTVKWVYDTDDAAEVAVAETGTVVTVKFKDSGKYNALLTLKYTDGTRIKRISKDQFIGDNVNIYYNIGFKNEADGKWYIVPRTNNSYKDRHVTFTGAAAVELPNGIMREEQSVEYALQEDITFAAEFEDKEALTLVGDCDTWIGWTDVKYWGEGHYNANEYFDRYSNGQAARLTEGSYFATPALAAGTYKMFIYGRNGSSSVAQTVALYVMDANGELTPLDLSKTTIEADAEGNFIMPTLGTGTMGFFQIGGIVIPEGGKLVIKNDGNANDLDLDFIALSLNADADLDALTN